MVNFTMILVLMLGILTWILTENLYKYANPKPKDCQDVQYLGHIENGVYTIYPEGTLGFSASCDFNDSRAWTVIQHRASASDFYKTWNDYQVGFGDLTDNFWLGNQQIHMITRQGWYELRIDLVSPESEEAYAAYNVFYVGDAKSNYELLVDGYSGTAGDGMASHNGQKFSTKDRDNDIYVGNCALDYKGGWWYKSCHSSNLNGDYGNTEHGKGLSWYQWKGHYVSMKATVMKIRRWQTLNKHE